MSARTKARKRALDVLFEADQRRANVAQVLADRIAQPGTEAALPAYSVTLVEGVVQRWRDINDILADAADGWSLDRLAAVDKAILRIAIWEILCNPEVPAAVAVDQAVELASDLSTDDSPRFVNGVLAKVVREAPALPTTPISGESADGGADAG